MLVMKYLFYIYLYFEQLQLQFLSFWVCKKYYFKIFKDFKTYIPEILSVADGEPWNYQYRVG
jgi:hypothetical protein